ncbi:MAG: carbohydrate ABC transporter permease [Eubacteriales bacterium]
MVKSKKITVISYIILIIAAILVLIPFFWMLCSSFKSQKEIFSYPPTFFPETLKWENYVNAMTTGSISFLKMFLNSMKVAIPATLGNIVMSSLAAYSFARLKFPGRNVIFGFFLASLMVPGAIVIIPKFIMFASWDMMNSYWPLILPAFLGTPFAIFLLRQFFLTLPREVEEAAIIDGCGKFRIWATMVMPLSKPILATLTVFCFQGSYNDFMGPLLYLNSSELYTVQLGLASFQGMYATRYDLLMAGSMIALIPVMVVYVCCQKYIIEGIALGGVKG